MRFKEVVNPLRILGGMLVLTAFTGVSYGTLTAVPEVDAELASGAVALLAGGYLIFVSRVRRNKKMEDR